MRIIYLNIEHGQSGVELTDFILSESPKTDIFCFEEINRSVFDNFQSKLKDFKGYWFEKDMPGGDIYCLAAFCRVNFRVISYKNILDDNQETGASAGLRLKNSKEEFEIVIVHGNSQPADKLDNPGREKQSRDILEFLSKIKLPLIIGGDFNLMPETKSVKMFERADYKNLVKDFNIKTTRSKNAWKKALENSKKRGTPYFGKQLFADYVFVSPDIKVNSFIVPQIEISDHLPMILECELK